MTYRLLALDLDGTVVRQDLTISPRVKEAVEGAMAKGVTVTLATTRMFSSALPFAQRLGVTTPIISFQGALIRAEGEGKPLLRRTMPLEVARRLVGLARQWGCSTSFYLEDSLYIEGASDDVLSAVKARLPSLHIEAVPDLLPFLQSEPMKMVLQGEEAAIETVAPELAKRFCGLLHAARTSPQALGATHIEASKGQGLAHLARHLEIPREEVMAIGDYDNDVDMVAWAGLGVAVGNASRRLLAVADEIVPPLDEDGAAVAIERYILR